MVPDAYVSWAEGAFTTEELEDAAFSGQDADPDGDGVNNFGEFVLASDPKQKNARGLLEIESVAEDAISLSYVRRTGTGAVFTLERSGDLKQWLSAEAEMDGPPEALGAMTERVKLRVSRSESGQFIRLRVEQ